MKDKLRFILVLLVLYCTGGYAQSVTPIAEEGKTWWYSYKYYVDSFPSTETAQFHFGLTVRSTTEIDGEPWYNVMYVEGGGKDIVEFPVAYLRETGEGCFVRTGIDSQEKLDALLGSDVPSGGIEWQYLLPYPGKYEAFDDFEKMKEISNIQWPVLLYPRCLEVGDGISYPWSSVSWLGDENPDRLCFIINDIEWYDDSLRTYNGTLENMTISFPILLTSLTQEVGFTDPRCADLFLYPFLYRLEETKMDMRPEFTPILEKVTTKEGEILWDDPSGVETVGADNVPAGDGAIYDLYGRRVAKPLPGSVYIRDGRKYVTR